MYYITKMKLVHIPNNLKLLRFYIGTVPTENISTKTLPKFILLTTLLIYEHH